MTGRRRQGALQSGSQPRAVRAYPGTCHDRKGVLCANRALLVGCLLLDSENQWFPMDLLELIDRYGVFFVGTLSSRYWQLSWWQASSQTLCGARLASTSADECLLRVHEVIGRCSHSCGHCWLPSSAFKAWWRFGRKQHRCFRVR